MNRNHLKLVEEWFGAEFWNHGSASGEFFITSKTSMGYVTSRIKDGRVRHYIGEGEIPLRGLPENA